MILGMFWFEGVRALAIELAENPMDNEIEALCLCVCMNSFGVCFSCEKADYLCTYYILRRL